MKRLLALYVSTLCFLVSFDLNSRVSNTSVPTSGTWQGLSVVDSDASAASKVLINNNFSSMVYDEVNQAMYVADSATAKGSHSVMCVSFSSGSPVLSSLGGLSDGATTPLSGVAIQKLDLLPNGDLVVLPAGASKFYVISNPSSATPVLVSSASVIDANEDITKILNLCVAGSTASGDNRIAVVVSGNNGADLLAVNADAAMGRVWTFTYTVPTSTVAGSIAGGWSTLGVGRCELVAGTYGEMGLDKASIGALMAGGTAPTIAGSVGVISTISSMCWDNLLKRLYVGTALVSGGANKLCLVLVGRFKSDDSLTTSTGTLHDNDILFERFAPIATANDANVTSMKAAAWSVNHLGMMDNPALDVSSTQFSLYPISNGSRSLVVQVDYATFPGTTHVLPVVTTSVNATLVAADEKNSGKLAMADGLTVVSALGNTDYGYIYQIVTDTPTACFDVKSLAGGYKSVVNLVNSTSNMVIRQKGQTVFAVMRDNATTTNFRPDSAVFSSHALYNAAGCITGWTPWRKAFADSYKNFFGAVAGTVIYDLAIDNTKGKVFYIGKSFNQTTPVVNEVGSLAWSSNGDASEVALNPFMTQINSDFSNSGVWSAAHFPAITSMGLGNCGLTILGAKNKVALMSTGGLLTRNRNGVNVDSRDTTFVSGSDRPLCTAAFSAAELTTDFAKHYKLFTDIDGLGDVLCAAVSCVTNADPTSAASTALGVNFPTTHGFVFVGGQNGIAVLRKADGSGFNASCGKNGVQSVPDDYISNVLQDFSATPLSAMSWKRIAGIDEDIHELVSTTGFLYAMGRQKVYRIRLHSIMKELFATTEWDSSATMFADSMSSASVIASEDLHKLAGTYSGLTGSNTTSVGQPYTVFLKNVVVVQEVLKLDANEYCSSMVGTPNNGPIFVGTNVVDGTSNIYTIKLPNNYHCNPAAESSVWDAAANVAVSSYKTSLAQSMRKLHFEPINFLNDGLSSNGVNSIDTLTAISATAAAPSMLKNGLYSDTALLGAIANTIGNLYVLDGGMFSTSTLRVFEVKGNVAGAITASSQLWAPFVYPKLGATCLADVPSMTQVLNFLGNGFDFVGLDSVFAHSGLDNNGNVINNFVNLISFDNSVPQFVQNAEVGLPLNNGSKVFASCHLENGGHCIFGAPFGANTQD